MKKSNDPKATVCVRNTCATVHGDTAKVVNFVVLAIAVIGLFKALK